MNSNNIHWFPYVGVVYIFILLFWVLFLWVNFVIKYLCFIRNGLFIISVSEFEKIFSFDNGFLALVYIKLSCLNQFFCLASWKIFK